MREGESRRRRDLLRAGAVAGLVAFGWSAGDASGTGRTAATANQQTTDGEQTTTRDAGSAYAFSYDLQEGDRFRVESRLRTAEGDPATETIPATCLDGGSREFATLVVRAYRSNIQLGYEGLFVPRQVSETVTGETTTTETTTTETTDETTTTTAETTVTDETTTETTTTETTDETTTTEMTTETTTATAEPANETTAPTEAAIQDETTTATESETETTTATQTTTRGADALPEIRVGEWYRVTSMSKCNSLSRLSLEPAESRTTALGPESR